MADELAQGMLRKLVARRLREQPGVNGGGQQVPWPFEPDDRRRETQVSIALKGAIGTSMPIHRKIGEDRYDTNPHAVDEACKRLGVTDTQLYRLYGCDTWEAAARMVEGWT